MSEGIILACVDAHNERDKPFRWTKTADEILDKDAALWPRHAAGTWIMDGLLLRITDPGTRDALGLFPWAAGNLGNSPPEFARVQSTNGWTQPRAAVNGGIGHESGSAGGVGAVQPLRPSRTAVVL